jgi:hypothetical protein
MTTLVIILFVVAILLGAALAIIVVMRWQERMQRRAFRLAISNQGNCASRYELWAEDAAAALRFEFTLNGASLDQPAFTSALPVGQNLLEQPAPAGRPPRPPMNAGVSQATGGARSFLNGISSTFGELLDTLGHLLPGGAGSSLIQMSMRLRQGQNTVTRVERAQAQVGRYTPQALKSSAGATAPAAQAQPAAAAASNGATSAEVVVRPQTPVIEPGGALEVKLAVRPATRQVAAAVPFKVLSRALEDPSGQAVEEEGSVAFPGMAGARYYLPYAVVIVVAVLLIVLLLVATRAFG